MTARLGLILIVLMMAPRFVAGAERTRLVYFNQPLLIKEADGKAVGPAADLLQTLTDGLPEIDGPFNLPVKRLEMALAADKAIAIGLARTPRREAMGLVWLIQIFADDYSFATLAGHPSVRNLEDARKLSHIACNVGSAPADFLRDRGFTTLESAQFRAQAEKLRAGRVDAWFERISYIRSTWKTLGFGPGELQFSPTFPAPTIWIVASPTVDAALLDTIRERYALLKKQGKLDPLFTGAR